MTAQEQQLIDDLVDRIRNTNLQGKDEAAEQRLQQGLADSPDAIYVLAQTVIVQKYGLEQAQARLQSLQAELQSAREQAAVAAKPSSGGSFLSHLFGNSGDDAKTTAPRPASNPSAPSPAAAQGSWQNVNNAGYPQAGAAPPPPAGYPAGYGAPAYGQAVGYGAPGYGAPGYGAQGYGAPMGGSFLGSALQTAAGVAMGAMAFQGVESLFHGFGGHEGYGSGFGGGGFGGGGFAERPGETVINNYNYDSPGESHHEAGGSGSDTSFYNPAHDASRNPEMANAHDAQAGSSYVGDSSSAFAGTGADNSRSDQDGGFDTSNADGTNDTDAFAGSNNTSNDDSLNSGDSNDQGADDNGYADAGDNGGADGAGFDSGDDGASFDSGGDDSGSF